MKEEEEGEEKDEEEEEQEKGKNNKKNKKLLYSLERKKLSLFIDVIIVFIENSMKL